MRNKTNSKFYRILVGAFTDGLPVRLTPTERADFWRAEYAERTLAKDRGEDRTERNLEEVTEEVARMAWHYDEARADLR